jgi:uncharacterized RDD family membrane protein YckC
VEVMEASSFCAAWRRAKAIGMPAAWIVVVSTAYEAADGSSSCYCPYAHLA